MKYNLTINQHNIKPHLDIERDISEKKEGLFTFNLRINQGNIEDYAKYRTVTITEYAGIFITEEPILSRNTGTGSETNAIRPDKR